MSKIVQPKTIVTGQRARQAGPLPVGTKVRWMDKWRIPRLGKIKRYCSATSRYEVQTGKNTYEWIMWWQAEEIK